MMAAKVICFVSAKGGTGKTTTSASFAKLLAALGKDVLLIDMDAATNGLTLFFLDKLIIEKLKLLDEGTKPLGMLEVSDTNKPQLFSLDNRINFIPATYELKQTKCLVDENNFSNLIPKILDEHKSNYNYIIIDTQAGIESCTEKVIKNSDIIIIVSEYDPISAEGVERFKRLFWAALAQKEVWILINKILPEFSNSFGQISKSLESFWEMAKYLSPIPWDADVVRALAHRKLAVDTEKGNAYTLAIMNTISSLLGDEIKEEIAKWKQEKEDLIKEPVRTQLAAIESKIEDLEKAKIDASYELRNLQKDPISRYKNFISLIIFFILAGAFWLQYIQFEVAYILTIIMIMITLVFALTFFYNRYICMRGTEEEMKMLEQQLRWMDNSLEDLKEKKKKYKTIDDFDLQYLIK
jgi:cellulose biosynthesis protein BcsQ